MRVLTLLPIVAWLTAGCSDGPVELPPPAPPPPPPAMSCAVGFSPIDFEGGPNSVEMGTWNNDGVPTVDAGISAPGANGGFAARATLTGNIGVSGNDPWSGGGIWVRLGPAGVDASGCTGLSVAVSTLGDLAETAIKLEDAQGSDTHERPLSEFGSLSADFATLTIPLTAFETRAGDPQGRRPPDLSSLTLLVTVSVNDAQTNNGDGTIALDDIDFE